jgi:hypothetical protein
MHLKGAAIPKKPIPISLKSSTPVEKRKPSGELGQLQIASFTPFFAEDADRPVHYYTDCDPYWDLSVAYDHKFAGVQLALETFSDLDDFRDRFAEVVTSQFFEPGEFPPHELRLIVDNPL